MGSGEFEQKKDGETGRNQVEKKKGQEAEMSVNHCCGRRKGEGDKEREGERLLTFKTLYLHFSKFFQIFGSFIDLEVQPNSGTELICGATVSLRVGQITKNHQ